MPLRRQERHTSQGRAGSVWKRSLPVVSSWVYVCVCVCVNVAFQSVAEFQQYEGGGGFSCSEGQVD